MGLHVTPEQAISFTKLSVALTCSWPPSPESTKSRVTFFNVLSSGAFISSVMLLLPLLRAIYEYRSDPVILGKTVSLFSAVVQLTIKVTLCRLQQKRFQALFYEMEHFCKHANADEKLVLQRYVNRYKYIHALYTLWCFLTTVFIICAPLYSPQILPTHAKYPFSVEEQPIWSLIFIHQSLVGFQVSAGMAIDTQIALLLRYAAARFEMLIIKLQSVESDGELNEWIREHRKLLRYTEEIHRSVKLLILATISTTTVAMIFGSLNLVTNQPLLLKALYALVVFSASLELFMYAWPADNLMHMCGEISNAAYHTDWFVKRSSVQKKIFFIILRSQKLETVKIRGILPKLSLSYCAKYLYRSFSYFTALRIMVDTAAVD